MGCHHSNGRAAFGFTFDRGFDRFARWSLMGAGLFSTDLIQKIGPNKENLMSPRHSQARSKNASVFSREAAQEHSHG